MKTERIFLKNSNWYFIGDYYQGSHVDLYILLMAARNAGELRGSKCI